MAFCSLAVDGSVQTTAWGLLAAGVSVIQPCAIWQVLSLTKLLLSKKKKIWSSQFTEMEASWRNVLYCSCALAGVKPWVSKWSISWLLQQEELSHNCIQWQEQKPNSLLNSLWSLYIQNRRTQHGGFFLIKVCECCLHILSASELETKFYLWKLLFMYRYVYILGGCYFSSKRTESFNKILSRLPKSFLPLSNVYKEF